MSHTHHAHVAPRTESTVSHPHDPAEREAERAADVVAGGGHVHGWSFAQVSPTAPVHRGDTDDERRRLEAEEAERERQRKLKKSPANRVLGAAAAAADLAQGAHGSSLGIPLPEIDIGRGLSVRPDVRLSNGQLRSAGATVTIPFGGPAPDASGRAERERRAAEVEALRRQMESLRPADERAREQQWVIDQAARAMMERFPIPPRPGAQQATPPQTEPVEPAPATEEEDEETPVQRSALSAGPEAGERATHQEGVSPARAARDTVQTGGEPLDPAVRATMESRFGRDFAAVRIHDDSAAHSAARAIGAQAYTVGEHIALAPGAPSPRSSVGSRLIAHELVHVVQQRAHPGSSTELRHGPALPVHRSVGFFESIARFFGGGTFSTQELLEYLERITRSGSIEDDYDSDNKARAIVERFIRGDAEFGVLTIPERVLLIREMLSGFTGDDDEQAILDLLTEAPSYERLAMIEQVGADALRSNFHGAEYRRLLEITEDAEETEALSSGSAWTVQSVLSIIERHGDVEVVERMLAQSWTIVAFDTAFDRWQHNDGSVTDDELLGLAGNTDHGSQTIRMRASLTDQVAAGVLFHELCHAFDGEPTTQDEYLQGEINARVLAEEFAIRHGLPETVVNYRRPDGTVDVQVIRQEVTGSSHYNPQTKVRIGRSYVGEQATTGWAVSPAAAARRRTRP